MQYDMVWNGYTICTKDWGMQDVSEVFHRIYYVLGGEAYYRFQGKTARLEPGRLYIFPILYPYSMWQNPDDPLDVLWFHVETDAQLCTEVTTLSLDPDSTIRHLLEAMRTLSGNVQDYETLLKVFDIFLRLLNERMQLHPYPGKQMYKVLDYINENIRSELSVKVLADHIGMERSYFSRKFKSIFNMTPNQYITAKRMKVAASELMAGASVYHSAKAAGYTDEKAFSRAFKRYMEISPGKYREVHIMQP